MTIVKKYAAQVISVGVVVAAVLTVAINLAGTTDGEKVAAALEKVTGVEGVIKTYNTPFTKANHEGLSVDDFYLARWKDGVAGRYEDEYTKAITPADLKK